MILIRMVVAVLVGVVVSVSGVFAEPEVFSDAGFTADQAMAIENEKLHVIYFTASWCPPCKKMKTTTWVDESVVSWLDENAIVSAIDVDELEAIKQEFCVSAMPTVVLLEQGEEIARLDGYCSPKAFEKWLSGSVDGSQESPRLSIRDKQRLANEMMAKVKIKLTQGRYQEALDEYVDLWASMPQEFEIAGLRREILPRHIGALIQKYEPARKRFTVIRDDLEHKLESGDVTWAGLADWIVLNEIINDQVSTISWVERHVIEKGDGASIARLAVLYQDLLARHKRYDLLTPTAVPLAGAAKLAGFDASISEKEKDPPKIYSTEELDALKQVHDILRESIAVYYAVSLIRGDIGEARDIALLLLGIEQRDEAIARMQRVAADAGVEAIGLP